MDGWYMFTMENTMDNTMDNTIDMFFMENPNL